MRKVTYRTSNRLVDQANLLGETANRLLISGLDDLAKDVAEAANKAFTAASKLKTRLEKPPSVKTERLWTRKAA